MTHITIIIALLAGLVLADAEHDDATPGRVSLAPISISADPASTDKAGKVEPPQTRAGGGEGGWPGF